LPAAVESPLRKWFAYPRSHYLPFSSNVDGGQSRLQGERGRRSSDKQCWRGPGRAVPVTRSWPKGAAAGAVGGAVGSLTQAPIQGLFRPKPADPTNQQLVDGCFR